MDMDPNVWGHCLWDLLFFLALKEAADISSLKHVFELLDKLLPCQHCRREYIKYKSKLPLESVLRSTVPHPAAVWLWQIHDMVNQRLGKICISYDSLLKRHATITLATHDFAVVDAMCIIGHAVKPTRSTEMADFVAVVACLLGTAPPFKICSVLAHTPVRAESLLHDLYLLHNAMRSEYGMQQLEEVVFTEKYTRCQA